MKIEPAYDYRNRVYSAELGRFLQTDPIRFEAGDGNLYRYVRNKVVSFFDPLGLEEKECCPKDKEKIKGEVKKIKEKAESWRQISRGTYCPWVNDCRHMAKSLIDELNSMSVAYHYFKAMAGSAGGIGIFNKSHNVVLAKVSKQAKNCGFSDFTVNAGFQPGMKETKFGDPDDFKKNYPDSFEDKSNGYYETY